MYVLFLLLRIIALDFDALMGMLYLTLAKVSVCARMNTFILLVSLIQQCIIS